MMTEAELRERLRMLAPQSDTVAIMDEFRRLHSLEEQLEALEADRYREHQAVEGWSLKYERLHEQCEAAQAALLGCETTLVSIAEWVEENFREGDKEYQLAIIARAASSPAERSDD